jgi:hypothetical protein
MWKVIDSGEINFGLSAFNIAILCSKIHIVTWMAKALLGNDSVNMLQRKQQQKYECLLLVAG